jgi:alkanesulfonate monooxygenase SsuD/methylene tetrahydromethanopterin reductase-like flavin-dependent oxidoreductase (luciferase family)
MEVILRAFENETFSYHGSYFDLPPPGIPDRGGQVEELTLVPRPLYPYDIWQAITSPPTLEHVPARGFGGVFWLLHHEFVRQRWQRYAEIYEQHHGSTLAPGEKRQLVLNIHVDDTHERAWDNARPGHDEFWKFLGPYGWSKGYMGPDGKPAPPGLIPTLEESVEQRVWVIGTAEEVAEGISAYRDALSLEHFTVFPHFPGESYDDAELQLARYMQDVVPLL